MALRMNPQQVLATVRQMDRLPFTDDELAVIGRATPVVAPKLSAKYEPSEGLALLTSPNLHMEFVVVKSARWRLPFGIVLPRYTVMMGFEHGEFWEQGPVVRRARAVAFIFQRMAATDKWLDNEYGRKK